MVIVKLVRLLLQNCNTHKGGVNKPRSHFFISEAGRTPYDIFKRLTKESSQTSKVWLSKGNKTHREVCKILEGLGLLKAMEVRVGDTLFKGSVDAIPHLPGEKPMALEIKTVSPKKFQKF